MTLNDWWNDINIYSWQGLKVTPVVVGAQLETNWTIDSALLNENKSNLLYEYDSIEELCIHIILLHHPRKEKTVGFICNSIFNLLI